MHERRYMLSMSVSNFQPMRHKNFKHAIPDYLVRGMTDLFPFRLSKKIDNSPDWGGSVGWASSLQPKGR